MKNLTVRLYTTFYYEKNVARNEEYLQALAHNVDNEVVDEINILIEVGVEFPILSEKVNYFEIKKRPSFQDFIELTHKKDDGQSIHVISNTDIYFNSSLDLVQNIGEKEAYALNRWDVLNDDEISFCTLYSSADTWIFKGKLQVENADYFLGQLGCDNAFNYDLKQNGYCVSNPSLNIFSFHLHASNIRGEMSSVNSPQRVLSPYLYVMPDFLPTNQRGENLSKSLSFFSNVKLKILRRNIVFQYYYDLKNKQIVHEHEMVGAKKFSSVNYYLHHDLKLPIASLNRFNRKEIEG